jgi:hypothetical protein
MLVMGVYASVIPYWGEIEGPLFRYTSHIYYFVCYRLTPTYMLVMGVYVTVTRTGRGDTISHTLLCLLQTDPDIHVSSGCVRITDPVLGRGATISTVGPGRQLLQGLVVEEFAVH